MNRKWFSLGRMILITLIMLFGAPVQHVQAVDQTHWTQLGFDFSAHQFQSL